LFHEKAVTLYIRKTADIPTLNIEVNIMAILLSPFAAIFILIGILCMLASWTYLYQWAHQGPKTALSHFLEKGLLFIGLALIALAIFFL
jgi:hypothetical protein